MRFNHDLQVAEGITIIRERYTYWTGNCALFGEVFSGREAWDIILSVWLKYSLFGFKREIIT